MTTNIQSINLYQEELLNGTLSPINSSKKEEATEGKRLPKSVSVTKQAPVYNGSDPNLFLQKILQLMSAIYLVEKDILDQMTQNGQLQAQLGTSELQVIKVTGDQIIEKEKEVEAEIAKQREDAKNAFWTEVGVGIGCCLLAALTGGALSAMVAIAFTAMMMAPDQYNIVNQTSNQMSNLCGSELGGKILTIALFSVASGGVAGGTAGIMGGTEDAASISVEEDVEVGSENGAKAGATQTAKAVGSDVFAQSFVALNPLEDVANGISSGKSEWSQAMAQTLTALLTIAIIIVAARYGHGGEVAASSDDNKLLSAKATSRLTKVLEAGTLAANALEAKYMFDASFAEKAESNYLKEQAPIEAVYQTMRALLEMLQGMFKSTEQDTTKTLQDFGALSQNFAFLTQPFKNIADTSQVLA